MKLYLSLITLVCLLSLSFAEDYEVVTDVPGVGKCKGQRKTSVKDEEYISYNDIPYAHIKEKGWFQPSVPDTPTEEIINPNFANSCPDWKVTYFEDDDGFRKCLVLKIDTKNTNEKLSVIVYLPGLDLASGNTFTVREKSIMTKDVVLVSVQYRVGAFGFLSTLTDEIPGNIGVLDIIDALKWIQKYITYFGGDPKRVTLNGEYLSAGLIGILTASPLAEGLFHQVIYQSGSQELNNLVTDNPQLYSRKVAYELGCTDVIENDKITQCLLKASTGDILRAFNTFMKDSNAEMHPITVGGPSGVYDWKNQQRKYPTLGGFVDHPTVYLLEEYRNDSENSRFSRAYFAEQYQHKLEILKKEKHESPKLLTELYGENAFEKQFNITDTLVNALIKAYLPLEIDLTGIEIKLSVVKALFNNVQLGEKSYLYVFKHNGPNNNYYLQYDNVLRNVVTLGDDFQYLYSEYDTFTGQQKYISELLVDLWTSFAATGVPTSPYVYKWPEMVSPYGPYLGIDKFPYVGFNVTRELTPMLNCQKTEGCKWNNLKD